MTATPDDPGTSSSRTSRTRGTVLYIEDNAVNLRLVSRIFERQGGVRLIPALLGELGLELARERPDLILLDLNLPDIGGEEVLTRLRADPETRDIPVVVLSADATPAVGLRLTAIGATAFVMKPISVAEFLAVTDRYLAPRAEGQVEGT
jgi:CheY-like chemotaxis protein